MSAALWQHLHGRQRQQQVVLYTALLQAYAAGLLTLQMLHLLCHQDALAFSSNYTVASRGYQEIPWTLTAASVMTLGPEALTIYLELSW